MSKPLVSVIVLCYNHQAYIAKAIQSAFDQDYSNIEVIVVDDASTDSSVKEIIRQREKFGFKFISHGSNLGNCKAFNHALQFANGKYVIDLAGDDELFPDRVKVGVEVLEDLPDSYGVHFSDCRLVNSNEEMMGTHYKRNEKGHLIENVPHGDVFQHVLGKYFICTPTMMTKRDVFEKLGGYDETLTYEDFDFWVRSSRHYQYAFSDKILVKKRILRQSLSTQQRKPGNRHILSTAIVCEKGFGLCQTKEEFLALRKRIYYEMKWATLTGNLKALQKYVVLLKNIMQKVRFQS